MPERCFFIYNCQSPVPKVISAGCGLAWCSAPENEDRIREVMKEAGLKEQAIHSCLI